MLTPDEEKFLIYWAANRDRENTLKRQLSLMFPIGLIVGVAFMSNFVTGWYTRATMVAQSQSTPIVLLVAVILTALFCSVFYKKHRWDLNEQQYKELLYKKKLGEQVQHKEVENGQGNVINK